VVDYSMGCQLNTPGGYTGFWEASRADVTIICLGNTRLLEGEEGDAMLNPEGGDRTDIRLPESQREFIRMLREKNHGKPVIAVITGGSAIALQEVLEAADAVLFAWYPGEQGGVALADIIFGNANPSGRLPVTFYRSVDDLPPFDDYSMEGRTYRFFRGEPLFPFGYGLSYSKFEYAGLKCEKGSIREGEKLQADLTIKNSVDRDGEEVVLVYASKAGEPLEKPGYYLPRKEKTLVGFTRVFLKAGETKTIPVEADLMDMHQWDTEDHRYYVEKGTYILQTDPVGSGGFLMQFDVE
jgi:beta-glucosidase